MASSNPRRRPSATASKSDGERGPTLQISTTLRKGATFHSASSPSMSPSDESFVPPPLSRSQSGFGEFDDAKHRRITEVLEKIDQSFSSNPGGSSRQSKAFMSQAMRDIGLSAPRSFLNPLIVNPAVAKMDSAHSSSFASSRPQKERDAQNYDSGLGTSVSSASEKCSAPSKSTKFRVSGSSVVGANCEQQKRPRISQKAYARVVNTIVRPLLNQGCLKDFRSLVKEVPMRFRRRDFLCVRDLEKSLVLNAPEMAKSVTSYLKFTLSAIECIQATVEDLTERDQIRLGDRPYTNGYFIDLTDQVIEYGKALYAARKEGGSDEKLDFGSGDEIRLWGGVAENGRPAELVRVTKDGLAISMATGKPVDISASQGPVQFKRSLSEQRYDDEEIKRSMARRKKNASPEELAPKRCREPGCNKEFKRPCDLTKHEKTHSRPWKCPTPTCKYHELGWPTEKEMIRHVNDKHSDNPKVHKCEFSPCPYSSKRESNLKQHMEKAHGWTYLRTKTNGRKGSLKGSETPSSVFQRTPALGNESIPSTSPSFSAPTPPDEHVMLGDYPLFPNDDCVSALNYTGDGSAVVGLGLDSAPSSYGQLPPYQNGSAFILQDEDLYAAQVRVPAQMPLVDPLYSKTLSQQVSLCSELQQNWTVQPPMQPQLAPQAPSQALKHDVAVYLSPGSSLDEGYDEGMTEAIGHGEGDFQLYPSRLDLDVAPPLFNGLPSAGMSFSQPSQSDFFQADWASYGDFQPFHS
ncbi:hypothetical protein HIM_02491 [Hirsutella minnesotensis 3608]|nr:hypothetical protein HIM_02491 [Hirsutella minnesotensis 3608]